MGGDAYWFPHDSNTRVDPRCCLLIDQLGMEGYGIYWVLVETLRDQPGYRYPLILLPVLARRYCTTVEKVRVVVSNYELFAVTEDEFFLSLDLCTKMAPWDERREINRLKGLRSGEKRRLAAAARAGIELQLNSGSTAVQPRLNKNNNNNNNSNNNNNKQEAGPVSPVDNNNNNSNDVLTHMAAIIGRDTAQHWLTERGPDYCQAELAEMDRQGSSIRNPRAWLLLALTNNYARWRPPTPQPDPNCPNCGGHGIVTKWTTGQTRPCSCIPRTAMASASAPQLVAIPDQDHNPAALAAAVAAKWQS